MFVLMATGGLLVTANAGPMAGRGASRPPRSRSPRTLSPIANGASRIFWGWVSDRLGRENTMVVAFVLQAVCLCLVVALGRVSGGVVRVHARAGLLHLGRDLLASSRRCRPTTSARVMRRRTTASCTPPRASRRSSGAWVGALLYEQTGHLVDRLLRQRDDGVDRGGIGDRARRPRRRARPRQSVVAEAK